MIKLTQRTEMAYDCTMWYDISLDKEYTIKEFISETKSLDNYAKYNIFVRKWAETLVAETSYGKVRKYGDCNKKILSVEANGGYGLMSYYIKV